MVVFLEVVTWFCTSPAMLFNGFQGLTWAFWTIVGNLDEKLGIGRWTNRSQGG